MQAKHFRRVVDRQRVDVVDVVLNVLGDGDFVVLVELKVRRQKRVAEPDRAESRQQSLVEIVGDSAAVLHLAYHVADRLPRHSLLRVHLIEMVLNERDARREISLIELVADVPPEWTELSALLHDRVEKRDRVQERWPLHRRRIVQIVLSKCLICSLHARPNALRRLIGEFDCKLQKTLEMRLNDVNQGLT